MLFHCTFSDNRSRTSRSCRAGLPRGASGNALASDAARSCFAQTVVLAPVKVEVRLGQPLLLRTADLPLDQVIKVRQFRRLVEAHQIRLNHAGLHQVNACQQHSVHVKERFDARRVLFLEELPLGLREAEVVVGVMPGDALGRDVLQFRVFRRRVDDQRRKHLLQHVAVLLQQQAEELPRVVRHQVDFEPVVNPRLLDGLRAGLQPDDLLQRQQVDSAQVVVRIRRREAVQVRPLIVAKISGYGCCATCFLSSGVGIMASPPTRPDAGRG